MLKSVIALSIALAATTVQAADEAKVREAIKTLVPDAKIESIADAAVPGFYEVVISGEVVYVSGDGKYLFTGTLYDIPGKRNLSDVRKAALRKTALATLGPDKRIIYPAREPKHVVTVFTDIDCGYCRRLHQQMAEYNELGISIEYLFFPRGGLQSEAYTKAVNVWCAADRNEALTKAKAGETLENKTCDNPIAEEYQLGLNIGVGGTPMVVTTDGMQIGGYLPPEQMLQRLEALTGQ